MTPQEWDRFWERILDWIDRSRMARFCTRAVPIVLGLGVFVMLCYAASTASDRCMPSGSTPPCHGEQKVIHDAVWPWFWTLVVPPLVALIPVLLLVPNGLVLWVRGRICVVRESDRRKLRKANQALRAAEARSDAMERQYRLGPYADNKVVDTEQYG